MINRKKKVVRLRREKERDSRKLSTALSAIGNRSIELRGEHNVYKREGSGLRRERRTEHRREEIDSEGIREACTRRRCMPRGTNISSVFFSPFPFTSLLPLSFRFLFLSFIPPPRPSSSRRYLRFCRIANFTTPPPSLSSTETLTFIFP